MKICVFFGISDASGQLFALIVVNCLISSLSSVMLFRSIQEMTEKNVLAWAGWILFVILVGFSPWMVIPYSDSVGLVFPILIWYLYTKVKKNGGRCIATYECIFVMGIIGVVGYYIKPQLLVMVIAIVIGEFIGLVDSKQKTCIFAPGYRMCFLMGILMAVLLYMHLPSSMGLELDRNARIGMPHFLMMGLNESTNGVYATEDVLYTSQFATQAEKNAADLAMARKRINEMGLVGLSSHLAKKILVNYNDGTFAWGMEGTFYNELYPDKNKIFSPFCKSFFYTNEQGSRRQYLATIQHMAWLFVLAASLGILGMLKKREVGMCWIMVIALVGMFLFECLFEARARYLYAYVPIFIMVALLGLNNLCAMGRRVLPMLMFKRKRESDSC